MNSHSPKRAERIQIQWRGEDLQIPIENIEGGDVQFAVDGIRLKDTVVADTADVTLSYEQNFTKI